jgi:selenide, water dikinase
MVRLTSRSACAGCASKLGSAELASVLRSLPSTSNDNVIVGYGLADDAGVYQLREDLAIVQTVDFFTPIVDDPFDFGRVAAANAISDIYAMGATPISALNIAAFPEDLDLSILERILAGGATIAQEAGVAIVGGHTIRVDEPKYGMAVTGTIDPRRIVRNAGARPGDVLVLTKPLGTGVLATALKRDLIDGEGMAHAVSWMTRLNKTGSEAMLRAGAHAATDITGFGLLGHANELARASGVQLTIDAEAVPIMPFVRELVREGCVSSGSLNNARTHAAFTTFDPNVDDVTRAILSDAQTSGGLIISVAPDRLDGLLADLRDGGVLDAVIGRVQAGSGILVGTSAG